MRWEQAVREGQIVRVVDGPMAGFRGEVKEVEGTTIKVAVQIYGRITPVALTLAQIEAVSEIAN